ncbi:hypothetical protein L1049_007261 [Liquidambar formosana]|uniref:Mediator of RNA polymerase II transcription subunit n=1 Tax=Liquidambar formosana TaxID=63359 RepID=A0AAP0RGW9_LIQFO
MEAAFFFASALPPRPSSSKLPHRKMAFDIQKRRHALVLASKRDASSRDYDGKLVDENMIVLRKRIHEMTMVERNDEPPSNWMEWEKQYYASYDSDVCEAMGILQSRLMNTRPSLALGMVALITLSVPTSTAVIVFHLMELAKGVLAAGIHLS